MGTIMSIAATIQNEINKIALGEPFTNGRFLALGSRTSVDKALSRLVQKGVILRVARGVFVRPKSSRFISNVMPSAEKVVQIMAQEAGEIIQLHGAEAARRFRLTTQMPTTPAYYTNRASRQIQVGNLSVQMIHTANPRKLQHAGQQAGMALSALWYLGKNNVDNQTLRTIEQHLSPEEFDTLRMSKMPQWLADAFTYYANPSL